MRQYKVKNYLPGFTAIELIIIIAIIGLLVVSVIFGYRVVIVRAKCTRIKSDFKQIDKAARLDYLVTNNWASDVNMGLEPAFVPKYLTTWPNAEFYQMNAKYDWEGWPTLGNPEAGAIKSISLRVPNPTPVTNDPNGYNNPNPLPLDEEFYHCVQDDRANPADCHWNTANSPTPLNLGGNCPVQ